MVRLLIYIFAVVAFVGCSVDVGCPNEQEPKPVRPIKPRPIVPDGTILRPRLVELIDFVGRPKSGDNANIYRMQVSTTQGEVLYDGVCEISDNCLELPDIDYPGEIVLVLDNGSEKFSFSLPEVEQ